MKKEKLKVYSWRNYTEYIRDNPQNLWFKQRLYGWGWIPVRWQGWAFLWIWIILFVLFFLKIDNKSHSVSDTIIGLILPYIFMILLLLLIFYGTCEKPKWNWGRVKN
ncbi:hypothetical protein COU57_00215 [Candidatus Pacearchaeota archaeon CG10_big_fil_rev_8_21_14_0_10_32_14]|nr:MAG: hypothetical protein COU57_00215 [Candidatus Pacearchaeota archaeon CG10_big_fil_rev_8_21_14_0_10_32_14]